MADADGGAAASRLSSSSTAGAARPPGPGNAISLADTPVWDSLWAQVPARAAGGQRRGGGAAAGRHGQLGGGPPHHRLRAGHLPGPFPHQPRHRRRLVLRQPGLARRRWTQPWSAAVPLHLMGLLSDGGVHSASGTSRRWCSWRPSGASTRLFIHAFMDGRDTSPTAGSGYVEDLEEFLAAEGLGASPPSSGRYYAMDRDKRWDRVEAGLRRARARQGADGAGRAAPPCSESYARGETDEFILPTVVGDGPGVADHATATGSSSSTSVRTGPASCRAALTQPDFAGFDRGEPPPQVDLVGMTEYDAGPRPGRGLPEGGAPARAGRGRSARPGSRSCTSPRRRSTRTSPSSSTGDARSRSRGRAAAWCRRPKTWRPTTRSPR